jgi:hypothetical protein
MRNCSRVLQKYQQIWASGQWAIWQIFSLRLSTAN